MGADVDDLALAAELNAQVDIDDGISLTVGYSDAFGDDARDHTAKAGVRVRF